MIHKLSIGDLRNTCDPQKLDCKSSAEFNAQGTIIGQERAVRARDFQKDVEALIKSITHEIRAAFEGEQYAKQQEDTLKSFQEQKEQIVEKMGDFAQQNGFGLQASPVGIIPVPLKNGEALSEKDFLAMPEKDRDKLRQTQGKVQESIEAAMRQTRALDTSAHEAIEQLDQQVAHFVLDHSLAALVEKYQQLPEVLSHLQAVEKNILDNIAQFKPESEEKEPQLPGPKRSPTDKYRVNVLVDNAKLQGAPVIVEMNPSYSNLFGRIEQEAFMDALVTNFTLIRGGSLHRANGGYLVLPAEDVIRSPFTWESLKRCLRNREIAIEEGIEVLTGVPAGKQVDGSYSPDGLYARANQRLARMADDLVRFNPRR